MDMDGILCIFQKRETEKKMTKKISEQDFQDSAIDEYFKNLLMERSRFPYEAVFDLRQ